MKAKDVNQEADSDLISDTAAASKLRNVPSHILEAFDHLVPDYPSEQAKASIVILKHVDKLIKNQTGIKFHEDVLYIIKRLISGLMSSRQRVREGFCSTLQALLQLQPTTGNIVYETLKEKCSSKKNLKKDEVRDCLTGELLAYGALIRSGHAKNNESMRGEIIKRIFWLKEKKQYYDIVVSHYVVHMMEKYSKFVFYQELMPRLTKELSTDVKELSPCALWLRLIILRKFPESAPPHFADTLCPSNYRSIAKIIVKTSTHIPNVHPCLSEFITSLADIKSTGSESRMVEFWVEGLAPYLKQPTTGCLQLLFNAMQLILLKLKTADAVKKVCSADAVLQLRNVMSLHDKNLSASARGVGSALLQLSTTNYEKDDSVQLAIAQVIIEQPGSARFDQLTGTKLLSQMKWHFTPATVKAVSQIVRGIIHNENGEFKSSERTGAAVLLGRLVPLPKMSTPEYDSWRKEQLILLMNLALFKDYNRQTLLQEYQEVFFKCLSHQMSHIKEYGPLLIYLVQEANKILKASIETETPRLQAKVQLTWNKVVVRLSEIEKEEKLSPVASNIFKILYGQLALHLLVNVTEAKEIINELNHCYKEARRTKKQPKTMSDDNTYEITWVDMVVELLLSLLPRENTFFRALVQAVFWFLCPELTPVSLMSIVDVLDPSKQDELINLEDDQSDEEAVKEEEEEEGDESDESDGDEEAEMDEDESDEGDSEPEENEKLIELKKKMLTLTGNVENEVDMDSVPQEELDNMNEKLGALVGEYLQMKNKSTKTKGTEKLEKDERYLLNFRSRVCDLLELYIKEAPDMGMLLSLVNPLFLVTLNLDNDRKKQGELLLKIRHLLFMLGKVHKFAGNGDVTVDFIVEEFNCFFDTALRMRDEFNPIIRGCYFLFIRCGFQLLGEEAHDQDNVLIDSYVSHLRQIFTQNKFSLRTQTVTDVCLSNCGGLWKVAELMLDYAFSAKLKCYWRTQALQILVRLYGNDAVFSRLDKETIIVRERLLSTKICEVLDPSASSGFVKGQYLAEIFKLLSTIRRNCTKKSRPCGVLWEEVGNTLVSLRQRMPSKTFKICRGSFNNIISSLDLSKLIKAQNKKGKVQGDLTGNERDVQASKKLGKKRKNMGEGSGVAKGGAKTVKDIVVNGNAKSQKEANTIRPAKKKKLIHVNS